MVSDESSLMTVSGKYVSHGVIILIIIITIFIIIITIIIMIMIRRGLGEGGAIVSCCSQSGCNWNRETATGNIDINRSHTDMIFVKL